MLFAIFGKTAPKFCTNEGFFGLLYWPPPYWI